MEQRYPCTVGGYRTLVAELKRYKEVERIQVARDIEVAREHGDISENAEFHAAKERQAFIDGTIRMLEDKIARAQVIDPTKFSGPRIVFGATVTLLDVEKDEEVRYQIVGDDEADLKLQKISVSSPIARALIGKEEGDEIVVRAPGGERDYEILLVEYV